MSKRSWLFQCILVGAVIFSSCEVTTETPEVEDSVVKKEAKGPVLAVVDGEIITVAAFQAELDSLPEATRNRINTKEKKMERLEGMIKDILLQKEAKRRGLDQDEEIEIKVERIRTRLVNEKLYKEMYTETDTVSEKEILEYYEENKAQYAQKERIRVSHILIMLPPDAEPAKEAEAKATVDEIMKKLSAGEAFEELAKKYSQGPSAPRGGDLGYFSKGRMVPAFEEVAFALKNNGDTSDVVRTKFGYHIIKLIDRTPAREMTLDEVRDRIVRLIESKKKREVRQTLPTELRQKADVKINEKYLEDEKVKEE